MRCWILLITLVCVRWAHAQNDTYHYEANQSQYRSQTSEKKSTPSKQSQSSSANVQKAPSQEKKSTPSQDVGKKEDQQDKNQQEVEKKEQKKEEKKEEEKPKSPHTFTGLLASCQITVFEEFRKPCDSLLCKVGLIIHIQAEFI